MSSENDDYNDKAVGAYIRKNAPKQKKLLEASQQGNKVPESTLGERPAVRKLSEIHDSMKELIEKITEWNKQNRLLTLILIVMAAIQTYKVLTPFNLPDHEKSYLTDPWAYAHTYQYSIFFDADDENIRESEEEFDED